MPHSGCPVLHGENPIKKTALEKKKKATTTSFMHALKKNILLRLQA